MEAGNTLAALIALLVLTSPAVGQTGQTASGGPRHVGHPGQDKVLAWHTEDLWTLSGYGEDRLLLSAALPSDLAVHHEGGVILLDRLGRTIYLINPDGAVVDSLGAEGRGPGELVRPVNVTLDESGNVAVLDRGKGRFVRWAYPSREVLGELRAPRTVIVGAGAEFTGDGLAYKTLMMPGDGTARYRLVFQSGEDVAVLAEGPSLQLRTSEFPSCNTSLTVTPLFGHRIPWDSSLDRIVAASDETYELIVFEQGKPVMRINRDMPARPVSVGLALTELEGYTMGNCEVPPEEALRGRGFAETVPAIDDVRIAPSGRIWVRRTTLRGEREKIDIFAPDGEYVGTLVDFPFPAAFLGDDRILVVTTDALDVPRITAHHIVGPGV